ncbi:hypothetical protein Poli38472_007187 [Pythium oligandrum]|uniref:Uncharacterized protein n=1 Tax=Pythium oligandrum TaxID=41045 RepID=A0A8K1FGT6_PYTOL|nr:hypothetical protein Poli38472_007187 [Pythium oligandrum]|eukprot:TMW59042.1 hypothetical protein Poli38472_007187 [Pythium oligandrum]
MKGWRRIALLAVVALAGVNADGSASAGADIQPGTTKTTCSATLADPTAPVYEPVKAMLGETFVKAVVSFITATPFGKIFFLPEANSCIANMNGTVLGSTLVEGISTPVCMGLLDLTSIPFMNQTLSAMTSDSTTPVTSTDILKSLKALKNEDIDQFCNLYVDTIEPCLSSQLLPSLAVVRAKYSNGCCDDWVDAALKTYGYSISGQITKMAQLIGDFACSKQTPSFSGEGTQRCGYTMIQSLIPKADEITTAAALLRSFQVPSDQMCSRTENEPYTDINGNKIPKMDEPTMSGCAVTIDRLGAWAYNLPAADRAEPFDIKSLMEDSKCLRGSELFPLVKYVLGDIMTDSLEVYFSKSCVHWPMKFADSCSFKRPAALIEWPNEPTQAKNVAASIGTNESGTVATTPQNEPTPSPEPSSASTQLVTMASVVVGVVASGLLW